MIINRPKIKSIALKVLVDTRASMLVFNEHLRNQSGLIKVYDREVELAGGGVQLLEVTGPV